MLSVETNDATHASLECNEADKSNLESSGDKPNKCSCDSCGGLIVHIKFDEDGRPLSPRHQTVFNRLYRDRLTKELNLRKLAAEQIEKEARECTYMPLTNNARREVTSTSSLSSIAHRERLVEEARDMFSQGKLCVECLKKVEISTGTYILDDEIFANEGLTTQSQPNIPHIKEETSSMLPEQIVFQTTGPPKPDASRRPPTPTRRRIMPEAQKESRHDKVDAITKTPLLKGERESPSSHGEHPPSEIIFYGKMAKKTDDKDSLNRFGFPAPSPTGNTKEKTTKESRHDEEPSAQKGSLPPRAPTPTQTAFSFDAVSNISSSEKPGDVPKVETLDSHTTPILRNSQVEEREQVQASGSLSNASTVSSDIPLRRDSYVSIEASPAPTPHPLLPPVTPHSVPFDEKSHDSQVNDNDNGNEKEEKHATRGDPKLDNDKDKVEREREKVASPPISPTSPKSETSMRSTSIFDREDSFTGPTFVTVAPTAEAEKLEATDSDWIGQVTECVACDDNGATEKAANDIIVDEEERAEQKAADHAYSSCEVEAAEFECIDLVDDTDGNVATVENSSTIDSKEQQDDEKDKDEMNDTSEPEREEWLENATEWAKYNKSASPSPDDSDNNEKAPADDSNDEASKQELTLAPSDEGMIDSSGRNKSGSSDFFGRSRTSADKSCSTVALTDASHASHSSSHWHGTFQRGTSEGEMDEFLDRFTDCVTCWKLVPWPERAGEEQP